jgi:hypothetical protein
MKKLPHTVEEAIELQGKAEMKRAEAQRRIADYSDQAGARFDLAEADELEAQVVEFMNVGTQVTHPARIGNGGEVTVATRTATAQMPGVIDTVRENPGVLSAAASQARLSLVGSEALTMAVDAAESIKASNSLEKMHAHQLAVGHRLAMKFMERAEEVLQQLDLGISGRRPISEVQTASVEASRLANASTRLMGAYQNGLLILDRMRRGGHQTVKVVHQHVAVGPGGQAVVAGNVKGGRRTSARGMRKNGK